MSDPSNSLDNAYSPQCPESPAEADLTQQQPSPQLTSEEMMQCIIHVQAWVKLMHTREKLRQQLGHCPSQTIWAGAMNLSKANLVEHLLQGRQAKQALMETSFQWVVQAVQAAQAQPDQVQKLMKAGLIGLEQGIETFNPSQQLSFQEHVEWWIQLGLERASQNLEINAHNEASQTAEAAGKICNKMVHNTQGSSKVTSLEWIDVPVNFPL